MKSIEFTNKRASALYNQYLESLKTVISVLPEEDQRDILMEINSHIYESLQCSTLASETDKLIETLDKLGDPRDSFTTLVADRKLQQATQTFNPLHVMKALWLNISNGFIYLLFFILYLFLFSFVFLVIAKLIYPQNTGLFMGESGMHFGFMTDVVTNTSTEILGYWFIPVVLVAMVVTYLFITLLLKVKYKSRHKRLNTIIKYE